MRSSYYDDFIFTDSTTGKQLNVTGVTVDQRKVIYKFNNKTLESGDKISISANSDSSKINIRSDEHNDSEYTIYTPSTDDLEGRTITVN